MRSTGWDIGISLSSQTISPSRGSKTGFFLLWISSSSSEAALPLSRTETRKLSFSSTRILKISVNNLELMKKQYKSCQQILIPHLLSVLALLLMVILKPSLSGYKYFSLFFSFKPKQEKLSSTSGVRLLLTRPNTMAVSAMRMLRVFTDILRVWLSGYLSVDSLAGLC